MQTQMRDRGGVLLAAVLAIQVLCLDTVDEAVAVTLHPGDILVYSQGSIIHIDPVTGDETVVTTGGGPRQWPQHWPRR